MATVTPKCGNEECPCGRTCECPFGACVCEAAVDDARVPPSSSTGAAGRVININIGILGHVNSGKTSLVRALSTTLSTAALDKSPQSRERGMTLDLGFSSFSCMPPQGFDAAVSRLQYTLVDCPGHASLIRTIISGAQIIDRMLLVVDVTKGMQNQTAECLVIGEILTPDLIVVLNKIDLVPEAERAEKIAEIKAYWSNALAKTRFAGAPVVTVAAFVHQGDADESDASRTLVTMNLAELVALIRDTTQLPVRRNVTRPLYLSVDHGFAIKGQGTVLTGTMLSGTLRVGDDVELPEFGVVRKVKSIQQFKHAVDSAEQGDRCAIAVTNVDASKIERSVACAPGTVKSSPLVIALVRRVRYFALQCKTGSKIHVTLGPSTGVATVTWFGSKQLRALAKSLVGQPLPLDCAGVLRDIGGGGGGGNNSEAKDWEIDAELLQGGKLEGGPVLQWALLSFEQGAILCPTIGQLLGSRLDVDPTAMQCRIAFFGPVAALVPSHAELGAFVRLFKNKERVGVVDRVDRRDGAKADALIGRGMFQKDGDLTPFLNLKVVVRKGDEDEATGVIAAPFGKTGKFTVHFRGGGGGGGTEAKPGDKLCLRFRSYVVGGSDKKKFVQD